MSPIAVVISSFDSLSVHTPAPSTSPGVTTLIVGAAGIAQLLLQPTVSLSGSMTRIFPPLSISLSALNESVALAVTPGRATDLVISQVQNAGGNENDSNAGNVANRQHCLLELLGLARSGLN